MRIQNFFAVAVLFTTTLFTPTIARAATSLEVVLPDNSTTGVAFSFNVTARNGAAVDPAYTGTVHFTSSDAGATLPSDYTFTPGDAGTHAFNATMATAGPGTSTRNQTITATDTVSSSVNGTDATTVKWAPDIVRVIVVVAPDDVDRTVAFQGTVSAWNADYQVVPSYLGTVHFRGTDGVVLPSDYTFIPADNGTHTFTFTANRGGYHVITSEDVSHPETGSSDSFYVHCPELTATANNNGPVCPHTPAILFGSSNQTGVTYYWSGPHTWFSTEQNPTAPGPGQYFLEVRNADGCVSFASTTVAENAAVDIAVTRSASRICGGENVTVSVNDPSSYSAFNWTVENGTILSGQGTSSIQVQTDNAQTSTTYMIDAQYTPTGCAARGFTATQVDARLSAEITVPGSTCPDTTLIASVPMNDVSYHWDITHGTITGWPMANEIQFVPDGTGDVTLVATVYHNGCPSTDTAVVTVNGPTAHVDATLMVCPQQSTPIPVALSGTPPFRIVWSDGFVQEGIASTTASRMVAPSETTHYTIESVSDALCAGSASGAAEVIVDAPLIFVHPPRNVAIARGDRATLSAEARGASLTYDWYEGASGDRSHRVATGDTPAFVTPQLDHTTSYWVEVRSECGSALQSPTVVVSVSAKRRAARS